MRFVQFGAVTLPQHNARDRVITSPRSSLITLPNGAFDEDGQRGVLQPARLSRSVWFVETTIDADVDALMLEVGKGRMTMVSTLRDDTTQRVTWAKPIDVKRDIITRTYDCLQLVDFTWEQNYPFWLHSDDVPSFMDTGLTMDSGLTMDGNFEEEDITTVVHTFTITNDGGARFSRGTLWIEPQGGGSIDTFTIMNTTNGHEITYSAALAAADILIIDFLDKTIRKDGTDDYNNFAIGPNQRDWMVLELGDNDIEIRSDSVAGTTKLFWFWERHYL